jgi:hypothetical protein
MTELRSLYGRKARVAFVLVAALVVLLTACSRDALPKVELSADKVLLPEGGDTVVLRLEVTEGTVTSVVFKKQDGTESVTVTTPSAPGVFENERTVTITTTFLAEATGPKGKVSKTIEVEVAPPNPANDPVAPDSSGALKGFANMAITTGAPSGLSVIVASIPGVTGAIVGQVKAETVKSKRGVDVTVSAGDGVLSFSYPATSKGLDSFEYTVTRAGREAKGKVAIEIQSVPSDVEVIEGSDTITTINSSSKSIILLAKDVTCTDDDTCINLDGGQTLAGTLNLDGLTITNSVKPKIIANMPGTRKSGTAFCGTVDDLLEDNPDAFETGEEYDPRPNCTETRVIELADNVTVEGIEITSSSNDESSSYFTAMFAKADGDSQSEVLGGKIVIKNVTITRSNGKPIYVQYKLDGSSSVYADYEMEIEGLTLRDANDTLVLGNPKRLVFKDSSIELVQPEGNNAGPQPFGDNVGVQIANYISGDITLDNVDVFMESTRYRIDFMPQGSNAVPFEIVNFRSGAVVSLTVKNTDVVFGDILSSDVAAFKVKGETGTVTINGGASLNNTVKEGSSNVPSNNRINRIGNVSGTIGFN